MTWMVLLRWTFRGDHKTGLVIHANSQREAEERVRSILPPTFFRAANFEISIAPTQSILAASSASGEESFLDSAFAKSCELSLT